MNPIKKNRCEPSISQRKRDLLRAVEDGTLENVKKLWNQFVNVIEGEEEPFKYLLLVSALKRRDSWISKFLIEKNCPVRISTRTKSHCTPLYYATYMVDRDIYKDLYLRGASIHDRDANQVSALELALLAGRLPCSHCLINTIMRLGDPESLDPNCNNDVSLFHTACWYNHVSALEIFLARGFSVRSRSVFCSPEFDGFTPLHFALKGRALGTANFLIQHDADFHATDTRGNTPLHLAFQMCSAMNSYMGVQEIVKAYVCLSEDSVCNSVDQSGLSHFHILCAVDFKDKRGYRRYGDAMEDDDVDENIFQNRLKLLTYLIKSGIDINNHVLPGNHHYVGYTALHFAASHSCFDVLKLLLENGANTTELDDKGNTPLHVVARDFSHPVNEDALNVINLLIESGLDINARNLEGATALHRAFHEQWQNQSLINFLMSKTKLDVDYADCHGLTYLHIACTGDDLSLVERLIKNGASIKACLQSELKGFQLYSKFPWKGCSALHFAIKSNRPEIVEYLLKLGADVHNSNNEYSTTPLHLACSHELSHFFGSLDDQNMSADWVPNRRNHIRIVELLLKYGASVNTKSSLGQTPLFDIFEKYGYGYSNPEFGRRIEEEMSIRQHKIAEILLLHGAEIDNCNGEEKPLLHHINYRFKNKWPHTMQITLIEFLLRNGANVEIVDKDNLTPLHHAIGEGLNSSIIDLYVNFGANVNTTSRNLCTPLHTAVKEACMYSDGSYNDVYVDKLLRHPNIDLNAQNIYGGTPLHTAMREGKSFCIEKLLNAGADMNVKDASGFIPIHYLYRRKDIEHDYVSKDRLKECIITVLNHIKKLIRLKYSISKEVKFYFEKLLKTHKSHGLVNSTAIDAEIEKLKTYKIDQYTSLYNVLLKSSNDMIKHVKNANLQQKVSSAELANDFPLFHNLLVEQYERGVTRGGLINRAQEALAFVTNKKWPDSCSENILKYFNNNHMNTFIECIFGKKSNKRSQPDSPSCDRRSAKSPKCEKID